MNYEYGYAISALAFLLVVEVHFFRKKRYPSFQNKIYAFVMILALGDLCLDILGSYTITHALALPYWVNHIINTPFYIVQAILPAVLMLYVLAIADAASIKGNLKLKIAFIPVGLAVLFIATNACSRLIFYVDPVMGYTRGPLFNKLYAIALFYFVATFFSLLFFRKKFARIEFVTITLFLVFSLLGIAVQYMFPRYLLTSMVIALSITMIFFAMQMPEDMLDVATGAFNYSALRRYIEGVTKRNREIVGYAVSLDKFFNNNEHLSFSAVNEISQAVVGHLSLISFNSWVFRLKGNVYVVLTENEKDYRKATEILQSSSKINWKIGESEIAIPFSVCTFDDSKLVASSSNFIRLLEITFEEAKAQGNDSIIKLDGKANDAFNRYMQIESGISEALQAEGFHLKFQPIYSVRQKRFVAAEALLRLDHPVLGEILPEEFIPIAEKNGTIVKIDLYVLKKVCQFIKNHNLMSTFDLDMITVNFSTLDFMQENFYTIITKMIEKEGVAFNMLGLEITESAATEFTDEMIEDLKALKRRGMRILLDDFGLGYSNIQRITQLPLYAVKIDRSLFVSYIKGGLGAIVFEDMVKMCKRLHFVTIVEGVDSGRGAEALIEMDVDRIQGFYYSKPLGEEDFLKKMSKG